MKGKWSRSTFYIWKTNTHTLLFVQMPPSLLLVYHALRMVRTSLSQERWTRIPAFSQPKHTEFSLHYTNKKITVIFTDSFSVVSALHTGKPNKNVVLNSLVKSLMSAHPLELTLLCSVPGHCGIQGNEVAVAALHIGWVSHRSSTRIWSHWYKGDLASAGRNTGINRRTTNYML